MTRTKRSYHSLIRRGEATDAIITASAKLFATKGYAATSVVDIANEAMVARPTVFAAVGAKPVIFTHVIEAATRGDFFAEEPNFDHIADPHELIAHCTRLACSDGREFFDLYWAARFAADKDQGLNEVFTVAETGRRAFGAEFAEHLARIAQLSPGYDPRRAALLFNTLIGPANWRVLTRDEGFSPEDFEEWGAQTLSRLLLA